MKKKTCVLCKRPYEDEPYMKLDNPYGDEEILAVTIEDVCQKCINQLVNVRKEDVESMRRGNTLFAIRPYDVNSRYDFSVSAFIKKD